MSRHEDKYITKLLLGFSAIIAGVLIICYACFERTKYDDWYFWGILSALLICFGVYFLLGAFVHKIKSDLIRRQKVRQQQQADDVEGK